jgi:hypothetical protein
MNSISTPCLPIASEQTITAHTPDSSNDQFSLNRTGDCPLVFSGARIGFGTSKTHTAAAWVDVTIYKTVGGAYIADVARCSAANGEEFCQAMTFAQVHHLVDSLRDADGKLDRASQAACEAAATNDESFMQGWRVRVP